MSIRVDPVHGSRRINNVRYYPLIAILRTITVLLVVLYSTLATAELLVRFPEDIPAGKMTTVTKQLERSLGLPVLGVNANPVVPSDNVPAAVPASALEVLKKAKVAYKRLALNEVVALLNGVERLCLDQAIYETCRSFLFDVYMIRGMALMALDSETEEADQAFRSAHIVEPTRVLDPKKYPPNVLRRFAKAWTDTRADAKYSLSSIPEGATFVVDGHSVEGLSVALAPGRHVIEARFAGHESQYRLLDVGTAPSSRLSVHFELPVQADALVWRMLVGRISDPEWLGQDPEVGKLLSRFDISAVLLLSPSQSTGDLSAAIAFADRPGVQNLPSIELATPSLSQTFADGLKRALDIPVEPPAAAPTMIVTGPADTDVFDDNLFEANEDDDDALDEDEDPSIRFGDTDAPLEDAPPKISSVVKSPWLWISLGVVAAIVGGVVISTQVE